MATQRSPAAGVLADDVAAWVVDQSGAAVTYLAPGRAAAASSTPVVLSTEDARSQRPTANYRLLAAANTTNGALISASARAVHKLTCKVAGAIVYIKLYDKATAPTVGTDVPIMTFDCPASAVVDLDLKGFTLTNGLGIAITGAAADADTTAVAANAVTGLNLSYAP